jgi:hypothetical protein
MAHQPPHGCRSGTLRKPKRIKNETDIEKILDSVVGCMRWLGGIVTPNKYVDSAHILETYTD